MFFTSVGHTEIIPTFCRGIRKLMEIKQRVTGSHDVFVSHRPQVSPVATQCSQQCLTSPRIWAGTWHPSWPGEPVDGCFMVWLKLGVVEGLDLFLTKLVLLVFKSHCNVNVSLLEITTSGIKHCVIILETFPAKEWNLKNCNQYNPVYLLCWFNSLYIVGVRRVINRIMSMYLLLPSQLHFTFSTLFHLSKS